MISRIKEILSSCVKRSGSSTAPSALKQMNQFSKRNNEGLFGLVVALMTFGLERLLNEEIFKCPKSGYKMYGIAFFVVPGIILLLINLLTVPASGNVRIWTLCESCLVGAYYRYGDFTSGFLSALCVGFVAPSAWVFLALFNGRHLVCWELGYQLNDKISAAYLHERGLQHLNVSEYKQMVYDAKSKSQACGAIFLAIAVVCLGLFIILRRSMLKPFDSKQRLPGNGEQTGGLKYKINTVRTEALSQIHSERPKAPRNVSGLKPTFEVFIRHKTRLKEVFSPEC